jgi:hypothetical protein
MTSILGLAADLLVALMPWEWPVVARLGFKQKFGIDAFDDVLGKNMKAHLDATRAFPGCSWEITVLAHNRSEPSFVVGFTDGGSRKGRVLVRWQGAIPVYGEANTPEP